MIELRHQQVVIARLHDFCSYQHDHHRDDVLSFLHRKIAEAAGHLSELKQQQLVLHRDRFVDKLMEGAVSEHEVTEFKQFLDAYLSAGDYADVAIYLDAKHLQHPDIRKYLADFLQSIKPLLLLEEERKPESERSPLAKKLVDHLYARLGFDACERALERKTPTARRRQMVLRRVRRNVAEFAAVLHFPSSPDDTLSPFLMARVEALLAACQRILQRCR